MFFGLSFQYGQCPFVFLKFMLVRSYGFGGHVWLGSEACYMEKCRREVYKENTLGKRSEEL